MFVPLTMNGVLTTGTTAGVWMKEIMTGVVLDGMKFVNTHDTSASSFSHGSLDLGAKRSCSQYMSVEL